ncbi:unnamed protein product, partial [Mesorhabditis spiculigera]
MGIFDPSHWLPRDVTWDVLESTETALYPSARDVYIAMGLGIAMVLLRILLECYVFVPIGWYFGWIKQPMQERMQTHLRGGFMGKSRLKRVSECGWRFCMFVSMFTAGYFVLQDQPQFADVTECWRNWPAHPLPLKVYWYYTIETAFYWSLLFGHVFFDVRRHDFFQMLLHHTVTLLLLYISWTMNMVRVGTLILFSHDAADIFLELGKLFRYANWQTLLSIDFVVLLVVWMGTRLFYYPFWIINSIVFDAPALIQADYSWGNIFQRPIVPRVLMVMLCTLLLLHVFWTWILLQIGYQAITTPTGVDDIREESESDSEDDSASKKKD